LKLRGPVDLVMAWGPPAIEQFERAVELDPRLAEAWAWLAATRTLLGLVGYDLRLRGEFSKAREAAQRALEIDDRLGGAHAVLGGVRLYHDWDFTGARRSYERAVELSPNDPGVLDGYRNYLLFAEGRTEEALVISERFLRLAPLDPYFRSERFTTFIYAREYQRALEEVERSRKLNPDFVGLDIPLAYFMLGRAEDAHREFIAFFERAGRPLAWMREAMERGWAESGWEGSIRAWLEVATKVDGLSPYQIAVGYAHVGDLDEAFTWLERGYSERDPAMILVKAHSAFDSLRSDPRFDDLLRRIGFPGE
jgi:tetratricopeptide (TPR) repeat protein